MVRSELNKAEVNNARTNNARLFINAEILPQKICNSLLPTATIMVVNQNLKQEIRVLFDCGSMRTIIVKSLARQLHLTIKTTETVSIDGCDGNPTDLNKAICVIWPIINPKTNTAIEITALETKTLTGYIPDFKSIPHKTKRLMKSLPMADKTRNLTLPIQMIIGVDYTPKLTTGKTTISKNYCLDSTIFGWVIQGELKQISESHITHKSINAVAMCNSKLEKSLERFWKLEHIGICDSPETINADEMNQYMIESIRFNEQLERYIV